MPNINIDDAYILGETGAQVDKVTGLFTKDEDTTSGEKAFAQLNIGTAGSNRNLLDNGWFTINQRGATSGGNGTYPADRWGVSYGTGGVTWSRNSDGSIAVSPNNLASHGDLTQKIATEVFPFLADRTVTASVMLADGTIYSGPIVVSTSGTRTPIYVAIDDKILQVNIYADGTFSIQSWKGTLSIKAAKLEFGSVSTLANDAPPDYGTELAKCQRYFVRISVANASVKTPIAFGFENAPTQCRFKLTTPVPLRATPTPSASGTFYLDGNGGEHQVTSFASAAAVYLATDGIIWAANSSGLTTGAYILNSINGGYIDLSADL